MKKLSREFIKAISFLLAAFIIVQFVIIPTIYSNARLLAQATSSRIQKENVYKISPSGDFPGVFKFQYEFGKLPISKEAYFDVPIVPFDKNKAGNFNIDSNALSIRDAWGYPIRENAYMNRSNTDKKKTSFNFFKTEKAFAYDEDPNNSSIYNCREDLSVTGYFRAYFEDVELNTGVGYDDETYGEERRAEACQVLQDISEMIMLDNTNVTPDILFMANSDMPPGALAAASSYFGYYSVGPDNGSLHKHIISRIDPTPGEGNFDAFIMTGFDGINWDVDSSLNSNTYDFYTVMYHEVMHTLGFRGLLPAAIISTGDLHQHDTFDSFSFKDITLNNPFINSVNWLLQVPIGAPSSWFVTNDVVYRGVKNIIGATPDGIRPVYSPNQWEQGSSLSHFDMNRAPGQTYVMHPSIGTNTERDINQQEKEVLCHLGYVVEGIAGCELPTPLAIDDVIAFPENNTPVCINPLQNDESFSGGNLTINSLAPVSLEPGDLIIYYPNVNCNGSILSSASGARSLFFTPTASTESRVMKYTNKDSVSSRISLSAPIYLVSCNTDSEEYICNGDFEIGDYPYPTGQLAMTCPTELPFWCPFRISPDLYSRDYGFWNWSGPGVLDTYSPAPNNRYLAGFHFSLPISPGTEVRAESMYTKTKTVLSPGNYQLSWHSIHYRNLQNSTSLMRVILTDVLAPSVPISGNNPYVTSATDIVLETPVVGTSMVPNDASQWNEYSLNFEVPNNGVDYQYVLFEPVNVSLITENNLPGAYYLDGVSLKQSLAPGTSKIKGTVYQDQNSNGIINPNEPGLDGIQIGLFEMGNLTPVQTTTTQNIPNLGVYEFSNLPDGTYKIALVNESLFPFISEPTTNNILSGYSHARQTSLSNGQISENNNFGLVLSSEGPTDIRIKKTLIDSTLSLFDRYITWRIIIQNIGTNNATNVLVKEIIPPGLIYHSIATPSSNTYDSSVHILNIPQLSAGSQTYIDITMKVPNSSKVCGLKTNIAVLHDLDQVDTNPSNNQDQASINLPKCKITVTPQLEPG